jgi:hypothetical protein
VFERVVSGRRPISVLLRNCAVLAVAATVVATLLALSPVARSAVSATTGDQEQAVVDQMYCIKASLIQGCAEGRFQTVEAVADGPIVAVELYVGRQDFMTEDLVIEIREGLNDGPLLATSNRVSPSEVPVLPDAGWVLFTFNERAELRVRDVFSIVVPRVSAEGSADWAWGGTSEDRPTDEYPAGQAWGCYPPGPCVIHGFDHAFVIHGEDVTDTATSQSGPSEGAAEPASGERDEGQSGLMLAMTAVIVGLVAVAGLGAGYWIGRRRSSRT